MPRKITPIVIVRVLTLLLIAVTIGYYILHPTEADRAKTAAQAIANAHTADDEAKAFTLAHKSASHYSIQFFKNDGTAYPAKDGIEDNTTIKITWFTGISVTHPVIERRNVFILMGE